MVTSVQFSCSVMSDSLRPHESQHARSPCPSPTPGVHPNSRASSRWCHPAISSSVIPFSSCPQSHPALESFQWVNSSHEVAKDLAPYSSTLAWKILWMEEPGRVQSMGLWRVWTQLSDFTFTFHFHALEKEMAPHSSVLAWRIPGTGKPGGLPSYVVAQSRTRLKWLSSRCLQMSMLLLYWLYSVF